MPVRTRYVDLGFPDGSVQSVAAGPSTFDLTLTGPIPASAGGADIADMIVPITANYSAKALTLTAAVAPTVDTTVRIRKGTLSGTTITWSDLSATFEMTLVAGARYARATPTPVNLLAGQLLGFSVTGGGGSGANLRATIEAPYVSAAFVPSEVEGLVLWLAADNITGLSDGAQVASWPDASGGDLHALQATSGLRPLYKTNIFNGLPVVRFDGTDDTMVANWPYTHEAQCVIAVVRRTGTKSNYSAAVFTRNLYISLENPGASPSHWITYLMTDVTSGQSVAAAASIISANMRAYNDIDLVTNGASVTRTNGAGYFGASHTFYTLGANETGVQTAQMDLAEVLAYDRALDTDEREAVEQYLSLKYAITLA